MGGPVIFRYGCRGTSMAGMAENNADRSQIARIAVHTSWAKTEDRTARTAPGTRASMARFEKQVDPEGRLSPEERAKRAENAKKAWFIALGRKSAKARAAKRAQREGGGDR